MFYDIFNNVNFFSRFYLFPFYLSLLRAPSMIFRLLSAIGKIKPGI